MNKPRDLFNKTSVVVIIFLFIGMSIVSSTNNIIKETHTNYQSVESFDVSKEILSRGKIAYSYNANCPSIPEGPVYFDLEDPGTITSLMIENCPSFCCATWTNNGKMLVCDENGTLWEINLCNMTASKIGGEGVSLNSISYNPMNDKLYGVTSSDLYEINMTTGEQTYIGSFGLSGKTIIAIAINTEGQAFIWDILFTGDSTLWEVYLESGEATEVCSIGENLIYAQDGAFDWETDILWFAAYSSTGFLAYFDFDAGELVHIGNFQGGAELCALAIPHADDFCPPQTTISLNPPKPDGLNGWYVNDVNVTLNATDDMSGVNATYYRIDSGPWKKYTEPFTLSEDGDNILIEYYSVDNTGNVEDVKHITLDIDQTEPDISLYYEVTGGNKWNGWDILLTAEAIDDMSGMERVEFYYKDKLQGTINGTGPYYECVIKMYPSDFYFYSYFVRGLICNLEITEEFVNFYSIITFIRPKNWEGPPKMYAIAHDFAGNYEFDEIKNPCSSTNITLGFYLFQKLTLPNNYTGHVGRFYISATFDMS